MENGDGMGWDGMGWDGMGAVRRGTYGVPFWKARVEALDGKYKWMEMTCFPRTDALGVGGRSRPVGRWAGPLCGPNFCAGLACAPYLRYSTSSGAP